MAQVITSERLISPKGGIYTQYDKNLGVATTATFVTSITVDSTALRESVFVIHNNAAGDLDYQILGIVERPEDIVAPTGTNDDDKGWVVLKAVTSIASGATPALETLTNPHTQIVVQIKHTTATTDADIWHRGEN